VLARHGVKVAVAVQPRAYGNDHSYLADTVTRLPERILAVAALDPRDSASPDQLSDLAALGFRGLRLDPMGWDTSALTDRVVRPLWDRAATLGLATELLVRPEQLPAVSNLAARTPSMPVVIEHLARYDARHDEPFDGLVDIARRPNVYGKLSALASISRQPPPHEDLRSLVEVALEAFGPERLMWGSDMPWLDESAYAAELEVVRHLSGLHGAALAWLLGGTARSVFGMLPFPPVQEGLR
jgi:predicted TIM-barrel fold metal-dependent hydrolase